jgi:hypothetical protein
MLLLKGPQHMNDYCCPKCSSILFMVLFSLFLKVPGFLLFMLADQLLSRCQRMTTSDTNVPVNLLVYEGS